MSQGNAVVKKYFNPRVFKWKIYFLIFLFSADIVMNSFTQFLSFGSKMVITEYELIDYSVPSKGVSLILFVLQLLIQFTMLFTALSLFWNTFYFQLGMVKNICREFWHTFLMIGFYPLFFIAERVFRLYYFVKNRKPERNEVDIWYEGAYFFLYFMKFVVGIAYYIFILDAAYDLGKSKYYKPDEQTLNTIRAEKE